MASLPRDHGGGARHNGLRGLSEIIRPGHSSLRSPPRRSRTLALTLPAALCAGHLGVEPRAAGTPIGAADTLIAGICLHRSGDDDQEPTSLRAGAGPTSGLTERPGLHRDRQHSSTAI